MVVTQILNSLSSMMLNMYIFLMCGLNLMTVILLPPCIKKRLIGTQPFSLAALIPLP
uniref:Uncharacterized protein n=1 Tax=Anguilla anguilla TaxID=7936 RepID=A0A0E9XLE0_ANGAN